MKNTGKLKTDILHINNLSIGYGKGKRTKVIGNHLSATIHSGELVCLLGENGTGKSTLIRTLCGFQQAIGGKASLMGKNLLNLDEKELALMAAVVLTDRVIVANASVEELVGLGRSPYTGLFGKLNAEDQRIVDEAIEKCGILHKKKDRLSNLSDGEKQKAFIAKALAQDTPLIILDEPTAFLDLPARVEIIQLLRHIANTSGKSVLMSTHDLDLALQMADRLWLLSPGKPLVTGSPEDLLLTNDFQSIFTNQGIEFDNQTGLFKVGYAYKTELPAKGDGFEFLLLQRAFARKGVKITSAIQPTKHWLEIEQNPAGQFHFYKNGKAIVAENSIEKLVQLTLEDLN